MCDAVPERLADVPAPPVRVVALAPGERRCPYCHDGVSRGARRRACLLCHTVHHSGCFAENAGCTVLGCPGRGPREPCARGFRLFHPVASWCVAVGLVVLAFAAPLAITWTACPRPAEEVVTRIVRFGRSWPRPPAPLPPARPRASEDFLEPWIEVKPWPRHPRPEDLGLPPPPPPPRGPECPFCHGEIAVEGARRTCADCSRLHHERCFLRNSGCRVDDCAAPGYRAPSAVPIRRRVLVDPADSTSHRTREVEIRPFQSRFR